MTTTCRICSSQTLSTVLDYGRVALADAFLDGTLPISTEETHQLTLVLCEPCGHLQIPEIIAPEVLFRHYIYLTGVSDLVKDHARSLHEAVSGVWAGQGPPRVVEAASNDGTVLRVFKDRGATILGIDPARNVAQIANQAGIETIAEFFDRKTAESVAKRMTADIFIARNVLAHVADLHGFMEGIAIVLARGGMAVIEVPHALTMFDKLEYDQVFHEHIGYHSLESIRRLAGTHGLRVFRVDEIPIHGGSIRAYLCRREERFLEHPSVGQVLAAEAERGLSTIAAWRGFARRVHEQRTALLSELRRLRDAGKRMAAYGASGKGQSMLQFCGIDANLIDYIVDKSSLKQGKLTPGTHIPVCPPDRLLEDQPDILLLSAWNFAGEIRHQQSEYVRRGGKMLHPLPMPHYLP